MDVETGRVMHEEEMEYLIRAGDMPERYKPVPYQRTRPKTGRNQLCPCQSGIKFKRCCLRVPETV